MNGPRIVQVRNRIVIL